MGALELGRGSGTLAMSRSATVLQNATVTKNVGKFYMGCENFIYLVSFWHHDFVGFFGWHTSSKAVFAARCGPLETGLIK